MADILDQKSDGDGVKDSSSGVSPVPNEPLSDLLRPGADAPKDESIVSGRPVNEDLPQLHTPPVEPPPTPIEPHPIADSTLIVPAVAVDQAHKDQADASASHPSDKKHASFSRGGSFGHHNKRNMLVGLALVFLLVSTGLVFVFVNQQQSINDIRNRAMEVVDDGGGGTLYPATATATPFPTLAPTCEDIGGQCMSVNEAQDYPENCKVGVRSCPGGGIDETCIKCPGGGGGYSYSQSNYSSQRYAYGQATYQGATNTPTPTSPPGSTNTPTPTSPPGSTNTPTPTQIAYASCNRTCVVNADCAGGLVCLDKVCRNAACVDSASCSCGGIAAAPTPRIPVAGTGPSVLGATAIAGGFLLLLLGLLF